MQTLLHVLIALLLILAPGLGRRLAFSRHLEKLAPTSDRKVHLLIIRHGLSCTNIVQKWLSKLDFGRGNILDPALASVGQWGSEQSGLKIFQWLRARNLVIDATMSSVLARAIGTTLLTFDRHFLYEGPVDVVPYIRELASSDSNKPRTNHVEQLRELWQALNLNLNRSDFDVDYQWVDDIGMLEEGNWPQFLKFLANIYIPEAITRLGKTDGSPLVFAVTTHARLIAKYLGESCGLTKKFLNNGVLHMQYNFKATQNPSDHAVQQYELEEDATAVCEVVYSGVSLKDDMGELKKLCLSDVGNVCMESIIRHAYTGHRLPTTTIESEILELSRTMDQYEEQIIQLHSDLVLLLEVLQDPDLSSSYLKSITHAKKTLEQIDATYDKGERTLMFLQSLKRKECWAGGFPNIKKYKVEYLQDGGQQLEHADRWWQEAEPSMPPRLIHSNESSALIKAIRNGHSVYAPCLAIFYQERSVPVMGNIKSHKSSCNSGLRCYRDDGTMAEAGEWGVCAISRFQPCDEGDYDKEYKGWRHGCRPHTECRSNGRIYAFSSRTCEDAYMIPKRTRKHADADLAYHGIGSASVGDITTKYKVSFLDAVRKVLKDFALTRGTTFDELKPGEVGIAVHSFCRSVDQKQRCASVGTMVDYVCKEVCCMGACRHFAGALPSCYTACQKSHLKRL